MCEACEQNDHDKLIVAAQQAREQKALGIQTIRNLAKRAGQRLGVIAPDPQPLSQDETWRRWGVAKDTYRQQVNAALSEFALDGNTDKLFMNLRSELAILHYQSEVIANGGVRYVGREARQRLNDALATQDNYLSKWQQDVLLSDAETLSIPRMAARANMYAESAQNELERSYNLALGIPDLPFYPKDGRTECMVNCQCAWEYTKLEGNGNWDIFWRVNRAAENCPTCIAREGIASPLQVRNGRVIVPAGISSAFI